MAFWHAQPCCLFLHLYWFALQNSFRLCLISLTLTFSICFCLESLAAVWSWLPCAMLNWTALGLLLCSISATIALWICSCVPLKTKSRMASPLLSAPLLAPSEQLHRAACRMWRYSVSELCPTVLHVYMWVVQVPYYHPLLSHLCWSLMPFWSLSSKKWACHFSAAVWAGR